MENKWVRHFQHSENIELQPWPLLMKMIHKTEDANWQHKHRSQSDRIEVKYPFKVASWSCAAPNSNNAKNDTEDVTLFWSEECTLFLEYHLSGEENFKLEVSSVKEALSLIEQDNFTTEKLYPNAPQFKWKRIS
ncbi:MAG: hypothetical protein A4E24_00431 [Methanomethylovorans sp. PtaU1.Bin093]|uniref:hypothetical protein n=2 Tax=Methanomethylovorans TaxID=101191 RepID=UPI0009CDA77C|nr:hypothetical protein [uncultured Methanomethylovorans sp.]OPY21648.1 MAG: hypothetical protein A4E24_00431 [Methanomethylovorans sp. PtaU1.Bin093]